MKGYVTNIENRAFENMNFREVLFTTSHIQLVMMRIEPDEDSGMTAHPHSDQLYRFKGGHGKVMIDDQEYDVNGELLMVVPAGAKHIVVNTSKTDPLQLYMLYAPPVHKDGLIHETRQDAIKNPQRFDGKTTES